MTHAALPRSEAFHLRLEVLLVQASDKEAQSASYVKLAAPINQMGAASFTPAAPINENTPKTSGIVCLAFALLNRPPRSAAFDICPSPT
ncbi:hypothetical protein J6590_090749 [Homalodisca vitripennis]|nr:hypothetical protein J6590_090749 [Homalodisca vitripennis]